MSLYYATTNFGKFQSLQREFDKYGVNLFHAVIDIPESRSDDVEVIAKEKVVYAHNHAKNPVVVNDAGFYIKSLNGFPRAFANFALDTIGIEGIIKLLEGKERSAEFRHCIAYLDETLTNPVTFISAIEGVVAETPRGEMQSHLWSKLGLIFIPSGLNKTLAEMTKDEYLAWSASRKKESKAFAEWYVKRGGK